jgi:hypothetical protein
LRVTIHVDNYKNHLFNTPYRFNLLKRFLISLEFLFIRDFIILRSIFDSKIESSGAGSISAA